MHTTNEPLCQNHHAPMKWKTGVSKKNHKPYAFWSCSQKMPDGSYCDYKPAWGTPGPSAETKFVQELDNSTNDEKAKEKDYKITRLAIAKSLIERGEKFSVEAITEADKWVKWCEGKYAAAPSKLPEGYAYGEPKPRTKDEIDVADIPF